LIFFKTFLSQITQIEADFNQEKRENLVTNCTNLHEENLSLKNKINLNYCNFTMILGQN